MQRRSHSNLAKNPTELGNYSPDDTTYARLLIRFIADKRFVEITAVFQGYPGLREIRDVDPSSIHGMVSEHSDKLYICNYR